MNIKLSTLLSMLLINAFIFTACDEKDPEPKEEELEKNGLISGTVTGQLRNGDLFEESVTLNYGYKSGFDLLGIEKQLSIHKYDQNEIPNLNVLQIRLSIPENAGGADLIELKDFWYRKEKKLQDNKLLRVTANFKDTSTERVIPIAEENNTYGFLYEGYSVDTRTAEDTGIEYNIFLLNNGQTVEFESIKNNYNPDVGVNYGSFHKLFNKDGSINSNDEAYQSLQIRQSRIRPGLEFWKIGESEKNLSEILITPADEFEINNYNYDSEKGIVNFDLYLKIYGKRYPPIPGYYDNNSTRNDLIFDLSVTTEVYSEIVYKNN